MKGDWTMSVGMYIKRMVRFVLKGIPEQHTTVQVLESAPGNRLEGKNVLITGGSRGLGYYIARRCLRDGAKVVITGRKEDALQTAARKLGGCCRYIVFDVTNVDDIPSLLRQAEKQLGGKIHCLVSNAGISLHEEGFRSVTQEGWDLQMDTNLKGNFFLVKEYISYLEAQEDTTGNVVVISSERAKRPDDIPYGLTKVASNSFVQGIGCRVIEKGIRINAVAPGVTASDMTGFDRDGNLFADWQPGKRIFLPEEVAEVVGFLLSDISACIAGEIITCDQGRYISHW